MSSKRPSSPSGPATQLALTTLTRWVCSLTPGICVAPSYAQCIRTMHISASKSDAAQRRAANVAGAVAGDQDQAIATREGTPRGGSPDPGRCASYQKDMLVHGLQSAI